MILTAPVCDWHMQPRPPRAALVDPVARHVLFISCSHVHSPIGDVILYSGDGGWNKEPGDAVRPLPRQPPWKNPDVCRYFFFFFVPTYQIVDRLAETKEGERRPHATAAGRCRSMGNQGRASNQSDGLGGTVGSVRARHPLGHHRDRQLYSRTLDFVSSFTSLRWDLVLAWTEVEPFPACRASSMKETFHSRITDEQKYFKSQNQSVSVSRMVRWRRETLRLQSNPRWRLKRFERFWQVLPQYLVVRTTCRSWNWVKVSVLQFFILLFFRQSV